jgi:hypothetical protein
MLSADRLDLYHHAMSHIDPEEIAQALTKEHCTLQLKRISYRIARCMTDSTGTLSEDLPICEQALADFTQAITGALWQPGGEVRPRARG